jgi:hypothetical protein
MSDEIHPAPSAGNGGYEHRDIGTAGVLYFLGGLAVSLLIIYFVVDGLYHYLEKRYEAQQTAVNPLVTNAPVDTRQLPTDYKDYLKHNFPAPQLEVDERGQLDKLRIDEAETLSTYDWVDQKAGTVRIPIDRAMDLIAQRGLPVYAAGAGAAATSSQASKRPPEKSGRNKK